MCNNIKNTIKAGIFNVISIINNKGGVGKNSNNLNFGRIISLSGIPGISS